MQKWLLTSLAILFLGACRDHGGSIPVGGTSVAQSGLQAFTGQLPRRWRAAEDPAERSRLARIRHQLRNQDAILELVTALPRLPSHVVYLASGSHLAPLAVCEALPAGAPCIIELTEVDRQVQEPIESLLEELEGAGVVGDLSGAEPVESQPGSRRWRFRLGSHQVIMTLRVGEAGGDAALVSAVDIQRAELVVSHDWSGDPLANLAVIESYLRAASASSGPVPLLMIEDLEAHPYGIDLSFFSPVARSAAAYGHRASTDGSLGHGGDELGLPIFGGGVVLAFAQRWWRRVDDGTRTAFLDFLLLSCCDSERQNVLSGGERPLVSPVILDWWTGFGRRTLRGELTSEVDEAWRQEAVRAAAEIGRWLSDPLRERLACRLQLYRSLMELKAAGAPTHRLMPAADLQQVGAPAIPFPTPEMRVLHRQALRHIGSYRGMVAAQQEMSAAVLAELAAGDLAELISACPLTNRERVPVTREGWTARYGWLRSWLREPAGSGRTLRHLTN